MSALVPTIARSTSRSEGVGTTDDDLTYNQGRMPAAALLAGRVFAFIDLALILPPQPLLLGRSPTAICFSGAAADTAIRAATWKCSSMPTASASSTAAAPMDPSLLQTKERISSPTSFAAQAVMIQLGPEGDSPRRRGRRVPLGNYALVAASVRAGWPRCSSRPTVWLDRFVVPAAPAGAAHIDALAEQRPLTEARIVAQLEQ